MRKVQVEPKEDITAFEVIHMMLANNSFGSSEGIISYLRQKCPSSLRHIKEFQDDGSH